MQEVKGSIKIITRDRSWVTYKGGIVTEEYINFKCKGRGIKEDPYIIDKSVYYHIGLGYLEIRNSNKFIEIQNCSKKVIHTFNLKNCQNVSIKDCTFIYCGLDECSKIKCVGSNISTKFTISYSTNIEIDNCVVYKIKLKKSNSILIKNTDIDRIKDIKCVDIVVEGKKV